MTNYNCVKVSAKANENIIPLLFKGLTNNVPSGNKCKVKFVGFEDDAGTEFKINGSPNIVPS